MGIDSVNPQSECEKSLNEVRSLTPTSGRDRINIVIAKLVLSLARPEVTPEERRGIFIAMGNKANSYETASAMRVNNDAMYIAREIRDAIVSLQNYLRARTPEDKERHLQKYRDLRGV